MPPFAISLRPPIRAASPGNAPQRWISGAPAAAIALSVALAAPIAAADDIQAASTPTAALIYPIGATVTRAAEFIAPAGRHDVIVGDLPLDLAPETLRVSGVDAAGGAFRILGLSHRVLRPRVEPTSGPERQALLDSLEALEWDARAADDAVSEAQARIDYVADFRAATVARGPDFRVPDPSTRGGDAGLFSASDRWREAWSALSAESAAARNALRAAQRRRAELADEIAKLRDALDQAGPPAPPRGVLTISLRAETAIEAGALTISYLTRSARWAPLYDLQLTTQDVEDVGVRGDLAIARRASVAQTTGEDWRNVTVSLSTARPSGRLEARKPTPPQATLAPPPGAAVRRAAPTSVGAAPRAEALGGALLSDSAGGAPERSTIPAAEPAPALAAAATEAAAAARNLGAVVIFDIAETANVAGDGERTQVLIAEETAEVDLEVRATPSQDPAAYLYAILRNKGAPLLPGAATLRLDGAFIGQVELPFTATGDEAAAPFGPLDDIVVTHTVKTKTTGEEGIFTTSNREESRFELTARNLGSAPRRMRLFDATPFTETEEITIELVGSPRPTDRDVDGRRGALEWAFTLDPDEETRIGFGFDLSWPEGRDLRLRP